MREIIFRGKRIDNGEWVEGIPYAEYMICGMTTAYYDDEVPMSEYREFDYVEIDPSTVGQYTGLTDKNGTKIFEGDIVTDNGDGKYLIKWINGCMCLSNMCSGIVASYTTISHLKTDARIEVIGNIHEQEVE